MERVILVLGGGGHARVVIDALRQLSRVPFGIIDPNLRAGSEVYGIPVLGGDEVVASYHPDDVELVNAVGSTHLPFRRRNLFDRFAKLGYKFASVIHPAAVVAPDVVLGAGVQVMAGAVVQSGAVLGDNVLINTKASVDHGSHVGAHTHVAPGATICGDVRIGEGSLIGSGAVIIQGIEIGSGVVVGAGSVVVSHVADNTQVLGVPARVVRT